MLDGDHCSRYQRSRSVLHHTQDGCRGSLSNTQAGSKCDQCNNRGSRSSKHVQTNTHSSCHSPLLSNAIEQSAPTRMTSYRMNAKRTRTRFSDILRNSDGFAFLLRGFIKQQRAPVYPLERVFFAEIRGRTISFMP